MRALGIVAAALALATATAAYECSGEHDYKWPMEGSCWRYYECEKGNSKPQTSWCFPLIRRFAGKDQKCEWFFSTKCGETPDFPPTPPPPPPPSTTIKPTTQPPTSPTKSATTDIQTTLPTSTDTSTMTDETTTDSVDEGTDPTAEENFPFDDSPLLT